LYTPANDFGFKSFAIKMQRIMNKEVFISQAEVKWYKGYGGVEYQIKAARGVENIEVIERPVENNINEYNNDSNKSSTSESEEDESSDGSDTDNSDTDWVSQGNFCVVYFDLETTGLKLNTDQICSIAASRYNGTDFKKKKVEFEAFLTPTCDFDPNATKLNGMKIKNNKLLKKGKRVKALESKKGLRKFLKWIKSLNKDKIVLVAHNCILYDAILLKNNLKRCKLSLPSNIVFADTRNMIKEFRKYPNGVKKLKDEKLETCLRHFLNEKQSHEATSDTIGLMKIARKVSKKLGFESFHDYLKNRPQFLQHV